LKKTEIYEDEEPEVDIDEDSDEEVDEDSVKYQKNLRKL
jgi:hypothetical protein